MNPVRSMLVLLVGTLLCGCGDTQTPDSRETLAQKVAGSEDAGLYCKEHGVPEKFCTLCHEELKSKLLLCKEHGDIPEDICTLCHPEVEKKHGIEMCSNGHKLPRAFCMECAKSPEEKPAG